MHNVGSSEMTPSQERFSDGPYTTRRISTLGLVLSSDTSTYANSLRSPNRREWYENLASVHSHAGQDGVKITPMGMITRGGMRLPHGSQPTRCGLNEN
jgi:hypothetical protein